MAELAQNAVLINQKHARQLKSVADHFADAMAFLDKRFITARPDLRSHQLKNGSAFETELAIEIRRRIADSRDIRQVIAREKLRGLRFTSHMHERQLRSGRFDVAAFGGDIRKRFAAERSAKVAKKDHKDGVLLA